jgi:hypothetical protein
VTVLRFLGGLALALLLVLGAALAYLLLERPSPKVLPTEQDVRPNPRTIVRVA